MFGPIYGYILDRHSAYLAVILSLSSCGFACLARGAATSTEGVYLAGVIMSFGGMTFETMALATVSRYAPPSKRALVVAGFLLQVKLLGILGRALYPVWHAIITDGFGVHDDMLRYTPRPAFLDSLGMSQRKEKWLVAERSRETTK